MTIKIPSYLQKNRYGIFYFRRAIPHSLRKHAGRTEVVCSLRTRELRQAVKQSRKVATLFDNWLEALESNMAKKKKGGTFRTDWKFRMDIAPDGTKTPNIEATPDDIQALREAGASGRDISGVLTTGEIPPAQGENAIPDSQSTGVTLSELFEQWSRNYEGERIGGKQVPGGHKTKWRRLVEILDGKPCPQLNDDDAQHIRDILKRLPSNPSPFIGMHTLKIAAMKHEKTLSPKTVNDHLDLYRQIFKWGIDKKKLQVQTHFHQFP